MDCVNKTLYIPLYGKAFVSRKGILLRDEKAEEIWNRAGFPLKGKAKSKWLAYNMGMRSAVFDRWLEEKLREDPQAIILHPGCGLDSRILRMDAGERDWFDVDFPAVIQERNKYFQEADRYHMIPSDIRDMAWLSRIPTGSSAIVVMEGISMYLTPRELQVVLRQWKSHFSRLRILMDSYTVFAAKATKYKNPIRTVGVSQVYGLDDPEVLAEAAGLRFVKEHDLTPQDLIRQLPEKEQGIFRMLFAGKLAKKIYRLYEFT